MFLTGKAGTGKTTFLKAVKKADPQSLGKWGQLFQYKTLKKKKKK